MATVERARGQGIGAALLHACIRHARDAGATRVWCHARVPARSLYERAGMRAVGRQFELQGIGPHVLMCLAIEDAGGDSGR
jgi:GNAT superfamily N-acetyltransferase